MKDRAHLDVDMAEAQHGPATAWAPDRRRLMLIALAAVSFVLGGRLFLAAVTGLPVVPPFLHSFDNVNFALALEHFDPTRNRPQPPGYPFFVMEANLVNLFFATPEQTFAAIQIVISGLALALLYLLARTMLGARAGFITAVLFAVNPVFWYSALGSPLRPHLALVSVAVAYLCWRALTGERKFFYAASVALGIGSGFRPELTATLFPLWAWTAWECRREAKLVRGALLLALSIAVWVLVLATASGGFRNMVAAFSNYGVTQAQPTSVLVDPAAGSWRRWAARAFLWNGLGMVPWIWTLPLAWKQRAQVSLPPRLPLFLALWFVPGFLFYLIVHIGEADHALSTIPALCVLGGIVVAAAERSARRPWLAPLGSHSGSVLLWIAVIGNLLLFFGRFPVPQRGASAAGQFRGLQSLTDAILIGTYEASYSRVRWVDQMAERAFEGVGDLTPADGRPMVIMWARDGEPVWRKAAYYLPKLDVYSLEEKGDWAAPVGIAQHWRRDQRIASFTGPTPIRVPVPRRARLVWLISPAVVEELNRSFPLHSAPPLYYTDLPDSPHSYRWGSFEVVVE